MIKCIFIWIENLYSPQWNLTSEAITPLHYSTVSCINCQLFFLQLHSDVDKGDGKVKYVLSGEGATSIFTIDENTGDIHATKRLDREAQPYYTLQAQAVDRITNLPVEPRSEFVVKVQDINDNEPKFLDGPYLAGVPEMSPLGKSLYRSSHKLYCQRHIHFGNRSTSIYHSLI